MSTHLNHLLHKMSIVEVQLISLNARREVASGYVANQQMRIEESLLSGQIEALEKEHDRLRHEIQLYMLHVCPTKGGR